MSGVNLGARPGGGARFLPSELRSEPLAGPLVSLPRARYLGPNVSAIYFISDVHLGLEAPDTEVAKEERLLDLFERIAADGSHLYILGDLFDFWFEYRHAVPVHGIRVLTRLQALTAAGTEVHYLAGNHDFALGPFISETVGCLIHQEPFGAEHDGIRFYMHHGDGLAGRDMGYRILKRVLRNRLARWLWGLVHPDLGFAMARAVSRGSRDYTSNRDYGSGERMQQAIRRIASEGHDVILMGHTHVAVQQELEGGGIYVNLGSWLGGGAPYARYEGGRFEVFTPEGAARTLELPRRSAL